MHPGGDVSAVKWYSVSGWQHGEEADGLTLDDLVDEIWNQNMENLQGIALSIFPTYVAPLAVMYEAALSFGGHGPLPEHHATLCRLLVFGDQVFRRFVNPDTSLFPSRWAEYFGPSGRDSWYTKEFSGVDAKWSRVFHRECVGYAEAALKRGGKSSGWPIGRVRDEGRRTLMDTLPGQVAAVFGKTLLLPREEFENQIEQELDAWPAQIFDPDNKPSRLFLLALTLAFHDPGGNSGELATPTDQEKDGKFNTDPKRTKWMHLPFNKEKSKADWWVLPRFEWLRKRFSGRFDEGTKGFVVTLPKAVRESLGRDSQAKANAQAKGNIAGVGFSGAKLLVQESVFVFLMHQNMMDWMGIDLFSDLPQWEWLNPRTWIRKSG